MAQLQTEASQRLIPRGLIVLSWINVAWMLVVVLWGAVVRATGSGAGCGDKWPLCNGEFFPHHPALTTIIEFTHRSTSGICTALVAALGIWIFAATPKQYPARRAWVWTAILLLTEALLGAVLVLRGYVEHNISTARVVVQGIHFTNTLMLIAAMTLTAWFLTRKRSDRVPGTRSLAVTTIVAALIVGATGSIAALADTLFPSSSIMQGFAQDFAASSPLLIRMRWMHPAAAVFAIVLAWLLARRISTAAGRVLMALVVFQVLLGVGDVLLLAPTWLQILHLLGADLFWMALLIVWSQSE